MTAAEPKKNERRQAMALPAAVLVITAGFVAWWLLHEPVKVPEPEPAKVAAPAPAPPPAPTQARPKPSGAINPAAAYKNEPELHYHPGGTASGAPGMLPHPITPEHERIFRENYLIGQLNGAMDVRDAAGMRRLLTDYRAEFPEDEHVMQQGYQLVINCIESPGEASRAAAKKYWETELASGLRRYIRRHCLENGQ